MLKEREEWKYQDEDLKRAKCKSRIQIKWKKHTKKTLFGVETKGKERGRLGCLFFRKIAVCNNYLLADNETKRCKKHHQRWLNAEWKCLKWLRIDFIKMGFLTNERNGLGLFSRLTYWQHCYRSEHYWRSFWRSSSLDLGALQGPSCDPTLLLSPFRGMVMIFFS